MNTKEKITIVEIAENLIRIGAPVTLAISMLIMIIAVLDKNTTMEAYTGSFFAAEFNDNWTVEYEGRKKEISLPMVLNKNVPEKVTLTKTLPDNISDGMSIMVRSSMEDIIIYVDGQVRSEYTSSSISNMPYYIPSAYVVADLGDEDAGKEISIDITFKTRRIINEIRLGYGNNAWFGIIKRALPVNFIAAMDFFIGVVLFINALFLMNSFRVKAARNLGLLMMDVSLWVISESTIRQFFFFRPSLSQYFSYYLVELIGVFACMYFDEVQSRRYHKRYVLMESIVLIQLFLNIILNSTGLVMYYDTLPISFFWTVCCALVSFSCIYTDIRTGKLKDYWISVIGIVGFIVIALFELVGFCFNRFHVFGTEISIALIILMAATVVQTVYDEIQNYENREKNYRAMAINTIETIAGAIDAKDEYTGGHSDRVGMYAQILAREMAADYDFSEEDILRIHYVGLVHDIGKIGVADDVLNKIGKLSEEELSLMKKHSEIGYEIMSSLGNIIEGLLDGVRHHHERFDGNGYPDGLEGTDIPLIARILALADSYDAMTSNRVYRMRLSDEEVRQEILDCAGTQFDPALAELFVRLIDRKEIYPMTFEGAATDSDGNVRNSAALEKKLQNDLLENKKIASPMHIRMLCYLMNLMEKKGKEYRILLITIDGDHEPFRTSIFNFISEHDVDIQYTKDQYLVALYDKNDNECKDIIKTIMFHCENITVEQLM